MKDDRAFRARAVSALEKLGLEHGMALSVTNEILHMLKAPDRCMLDAGSDELFTRGPGGGTRGCARHQQPTPFPF